MATASQQTGPFSFLNPTTRRLPLPGKHRKKDTNNAAGSGSEDEIASKPAGNTPPEQSEDIKADDFYQKWRSRDNRKGRHAIAVVSTDSSSPKYLVPPSTSTLKATVQGIWRMVTVYPYWDVSYLVAVIFTLGSVVWVFNAFFVWLPLAAPPTEFSGEEETAGGWTAFIGASIFELGSVLLMIEAVNENKSDCFGWALEEVLEENGLMRLAPSQNCQHHHGNRNNFVGKGKSSTETPSQDNGASSNSHPTRTWTWFPTWHELKTHYFREIGFLACFAQLFGATVFWISGFTALSEINSVLAKNQRALNGAFWAPQIIGGSGFIVSGVLFMLETQKKWYLPAPKVLGWHIGLWNLIGALGFTLCGCLGPSSATNTRTEYESSVATFWGSWAFLIGSAIQWYESLDKHPVDVEQSGGRVAETQATA